MWATRAPDGQIHVVAINKSPTRNRTITVRLPRGATAGATLERMRAPSVHSRRDVTLGGRTYGRETYTGTLPSPRTGPLSGAAGTYTFTLPRGSAALLTASP
jgi:hypothetical protein